MEINKICVVGGGLMGRQIALCASIHGYDATVYDHFKELYDKGYYGRKTGHGFYDYE